MCHLDTLICTYMYIESHQNRQSLWCHLYSYIIPLSTVFNLIICQLLFRVPKRSLVCMISHFLSISPHKRVWQLVTCLSTVYCVCKIYWYSSFLTICMALYPVIRALFQCQCYLWQDRNLQSHCVTVEWLTISFPGNNIVEQQHYHGLYLPHFIPVAGCHQSLCRA